MPRLACWSCGRSLYTVAPLASLFLDERRCPRCGAFLQPERREIDRRSLVRRGNEADEPGPPLGEEDRRDIDRRLEQRRGTGSASGTGTGAASRRTG